MTTMPEIRRSELTSVRQFLMSLRDEPEAGGFSGGFPRDGAPLRAKLRRVRSNDHALAGSAIPAFG